LVRKAIASFKAKDNKIFKLYLSLIHTAIFPNVNLYDCRELLEEIQQIAEGLGLHDRRSEVIAPMLARLMITIKRVFGKQHDVRRGDYTVKEYNRFKDAQRGIERKEIGKGDYDDSNDDDYEEPE
jgi:hypothetical protein